MPKKRPSKKSSSPKPSKSSDSGIRLQRVLAAAGYGSRRKCEDLITQGRVDIDGKTVTELGVRVDTSVSKVTVDGVRLKPPRLVYFALNKPVGILTTNRDPQGRPRVVDMIQERERVFPVGRLDRSSEGLILLTNDGDLAEQLAHPRYGVKKTYLVTVAGIVDTDTIKKMQKGVHFTEGLFQVEGAKIKRTRGKATELEIILSEGKNREIRRILARLGHKVLQLKRTAIGNVRLGTMPTGAYRPLNSRELKKLREEIAISRRAQSGEDASHKKMASRRSSGPRKKSASAGRPSIGKRAQPKAKRPTRSSANDIVISAEPGIASSGTVIGAPGEAKPSRKKKRPARSASTNRPQRKSTSRKTKPTGKPSRKKKRRR